MDLQTRKLNIIQYLIDLNDEQMFNEIESSIYDVMKSDDSEISSNRFSAQELIDRAQWSNSDYKVGNFKTQDELEKESENW